MEALFQIVGCVLSSEIAPRRIDDFVAQVRRERAVVTVKDARGATFVRFNAPDARLVTLACEAVLSKEAPSLRFGFASGIKEPMREGQDGLSISHRSIAQANDLVAGARDGEVLVTPQLASLLAESGLSFRPKDLQLPDGRTVPACLLDVSVGVAEKSAPAGPPPLEGKVTDALIRIYQTLISQAGEVTRKQADLEARLDAALGKATPTDTSLRGATKPGELTAERDTPQMRMQERLQFIEMIEERVNTLQQTASDAERKLAEVLTRHVEIEHLRSLCDTLATQMVQVQQQLDGMAVMQRQLLPLASQVSALVQSLENSGRSVAAFEGRLNDLDRGAQAVEQKIKSLADREALVQAVKAEVENIRKISSRSKADLQFVTEHRDDVTDLRAKVEDLLGRVSDTDGKIVMIESRRKSVEEVQSRANAITHMLADINVNLELLSEQRAVVDHVGEQLARLDFTVQEAQNTLRALQREREVAERIEQGIKALRTRGGAYRMP